MPSAAIDHATIERLPEWDGGRPHPRGLGYIFDDAMGGRPGSPPPTSPKRARAGTSQGVERAGFSDSRYRRLTRRMDTMHHMHRRFAQDLTQALGTAFRATGVDIEWLVFGADMVYPPPYSSPDEGEESTGSDSF